MNIIRLPHKAQSKSLLLLFWLPVILGSCNSEPGTATEAGRLNVIATTGMIADAVKNIAGDLVDVSALMGPGVDPHLYKATQGDIAKLTEADLILYNGLLLEGKMGEVLGKLERTR
ncbi:MAG: metal ABC transporter solute-binding protein, Zn/Mn family, partial [Cyclobacteriaceae bacterium]